MRLRTDDRFAAEAAGLVAAGLPLTTELAYRVREKMTVLGSVPPADPGDTWCVRWRGHGIVGTPEYLPGPIAGYAICCPGCHQVHCWTSATNCGPRNEYGSCPHNGTGSCWTWTGSAEANTLTASPSLYASNACGWHGWLQNGQLRHC